MMVSWQDFPVGRTISTQSLTVTEPHVVQWAGLTGDWYPLHTDAVAAARGPFGERVAHGPLTFALAVGLMDRTGVYGDAILAWLGTRELRALRPVRLGDTIHVVATVVSSRATQKPNRGVLTLDYSVRNQDGDEVLRCDFSLLMRSRP